MSWASLFSVGGCVISLGRYKGARCDKSSHIELYIDVLLLVSRCKVAPPWCKDPPIHPTLTPIIHSQ